jgi:hypothetical protein
MAPQRAQRIVAQQKLFGHWPSIEVPDRIGKAILDRLGGYTGYDEIAKK